MTFLELVETILRGEGYKIVVPRGSPKTTSLIWEAVVIASIAKEYRLSTQQIVRLVDELSKTTSAPNCPAEEIEVASRQQRCPHDNGDGKRGDTD